MRFKARWFGSTLITLLALLLVGATALAAPAVAPSAQADLIVTVTASPGGAFPAQVTVYLALLSGGDARQAVVTPGSPQTTFTDLQRNHIYIVQAVPATSSGAFPSALQQAIIPPVGDPAAETLQLSDTPPVMGHVMTPDQSRGQPATVKVLNAACTTELFTVGTSAQGYYELSLRDGGYCLQAEPQDTVHFQASQFRPVVSVAAVPQTVDLILRANAMNTIMGQASTNEAPPQPVQNARIVAQNIATSDTVSTTTNAGGHYTLQVPAAPAVWLLQAEVMGSTQPPGLTPPLPKQVTFLSSEAVTVTRDFTFTVASQDAHITGRVLVTDTTPYVPTIPVTVTAVNLLNLQRTSTQIDPGDGSFDLTVEPGFYQILVTPSDLTLFLPLNLPRVQVTEGETKDLGELYLTPLNVGNLATIAGFVRTPAGDAVPGVRVIAIRTSDRKPALPTVTRADGSFTLVVPAGTWWVAVSLSEGDPYMPYKTQWQTLVTVAAHDVVDDVALVVAPADATIHGILTQGEGGPQATDACGVVAAYKKGEPSVYNFATFSDGEFDLTVITGTYRLEVLPDPGVEALGQFLPEGCAAGKYLPTTVRAVSVTHTGITNVTVPLQSDSATIHGQLWDRFLDEPVTDWGGQLFGWNPALKTWSAAAVDPTTGRGDLRATSGDWLLKFRINPNSGYREAPSVVTTTVPANGGDVDVHLPVMRTAIPVPGQVLDPDGNPVGLVLVRAVGAPGGDAAISRQSGAFTLTLTSGVYVVEVAGPAELLADNDWISPAPQKLVLTPDTAPPPLTLQYRRGDADIHGRLTLSGTLAAAADGDEKRAMVWAMTAGAHTKTWVSMPMAAGEEYHLPALQGQQWLVSASYWDGEQAWFAQQQVTVSGSDVPLDLTLVPVSETDVVQRITQAIDTAKAFYAELSDGASLYVPAGALADAALTADANTSLTTQGQIKKTIDFYKNCVDFVDIDGDGIPDGVWRYFCLKNQLPLHAASVQRGDSVGPLPPIPELEKLSEGYTLGGLDGAGGRLPDSAIRAPLILHLSYDGAGSAPLVMYAPPPAAAGAGVSALSVASTTQAGGWTYYSDYVVDEANQEVVIFVEQWGSYALAESVIPDQLYLPLTLK